MRTKQGLTEIYHKFVRPLAADSPHWQIEVAGRPASTGISTAASRQDHAWRYGMGTGQAAPSIDHLAAACRKPGTVPLQICMCCCGSVTCPAGHLFNSSGATVQVEPANWVVGAVQATSACQLRRKAQLLSLCFALLATSAITLFAFSSSKSQVSFAKRCVAAPGFTRLSIDLSKSRWGKNRRTSLIFVFQDHSYCYK